MIKKTKKQFSWPSVVLTLLFTFIFLLSGFLLISTVVQAATINVPGDYPTIQQAINAANLDDTINVATGTYQEDIAINKSLTLQGAGKTATTILRDTEINQVVLIQASNVKIDGFKIDGGTAPYACSNIVKLSTAGSPPYENIEITNSHILHSVNSAVSLTGKDKDSVGRGYRVNDNIIEYFADGSGNAGVYVNFALDAEVKRNTITNSNPTSYLYGGTGVYFFDYSSGTISNNNISKCYGSIMVNSNVEETYIDSNTISSRYGVLEVEAFKKIHITNNIITTRQIKTPPDYHNEKGIVLGGDGDWYDSCPPYDWQVDNLQHEVSGNTITGTYKGGEGSIGIVVQPGMIDRDYGASGTVMGNTISNYDNGLKVYGKSGGVDLTNHVHTSFSFNNITDCITDGDVSDWTGAAESINAEHNWWGDNAGPSSISDRYDYTPWTTAETENGKVDTVTDPNPAPVENIEAGIEVAVSSASYSDPGAGGIIGTANYATTPQTATSFSDGIDETAAIYVDVFASGFTAGSAKIIVTYNDTDVAGLDENTLNLYIWHDNQWNLGSDPGRDTVNNEVWGIFDVTKLTGSPAALGGATPPNAPTSLLCNGETNPTGLTDFTPEFSWTFSDPHVGYTQDAYQIIIGTIEGSSDMWDSGKVASSSTNVTYAGSDLSWGETYHWKAKTWNNHNAESTYSADQTFTIVEEPRPVPTPTNGYIATTPASAGGPQVLLYLYDGTLISNFMAYNESLRGNFSTVTGNFRGTGQDEIVTLPGPGFGPHFKVFKADGTLLSETIVYDESFKGGLNAIAGDFNGDGLDEIAVAPLSDGGPQIMIYRMEGSELVLLDQFFAYDEAYRGGLNLASGNTDGSDRSSLILSPTSGNTPHVKVFKYLDFAFTLKAHAFAYDEDFRGGVNIATGDLDGDSQAEVITAPAGEGGPNIRVYSYSSGNLDLLDWEFTYDEDFHGGVNINTGDLNGDAQAELIVAPMSHGGPNVRVYTLQNNNLSLLDWLFVYDEDFHGGLNVKAQDLNNDGKAELVVAPKAGGGPNLRVYNFQGSVFELLDWFWAYDESFFGGVNIALGKR